MARVRHFDEDEDIELAQQDQQEQNVPISIIIQKQEIGTSKRKLTSLAWLIFDDIFFSGSMPLLTSYIHNYDFYPLHIDINALTIWQHAYYYLIHLPFLVLYYANIVLRGVGQVYICNHPVTGICVCIGLYLTSPVLMVYALLGTLFENFGAWLVCRPVIGEVDAGLFGYDGTLVGCAVYSFLSLSSSELVEPSLSNRGMLILFVLSSAVGVVHSSCVNMNNLPALTLAFNILTMAVILSLARGNAKFATLTWQVPTPAVVVEESDWGDMSLLFIVDAMFRGVGQFCFVDTTLGGGFVVLGIAICSRRAGYMALLGSLTSMAVCYYVVLIPTASHNVIRTGIYGYNSVGTCVAVGGDIFFKSSIPNTMVAILGAALAVLMQVAIQSVLNTDSLALPVLTCPFVLTAWMVMLSRSDWLVPITGVGEDLDDALQMDRRRDTWMHRPQKEYHMESKERAARRQELLKLASPVPNKGTSKGAGGASGGTSAVPDFKSLGTNNTSNSNTNSNMNTSNNVVGSNNTSNNTSTSSSKNNGLNSTNKSNNTTHSPRAIMYLEGGREEQKN